MLPCIECGNPVVVEDGAPYVRCYSCGVRYHTHPGGLVPYYRLRPEVSLPDAALVARQWLEQTLRFKGLQGQTMLGQPKAYDFLFWSFLEPNQEVAETQILAPAVATALSELALLTIPARFLVSEMSSEADDEQVTPTFKAADAWRRTGYTEALVDDRVSLVRVPLYEFPYTYDGRSFRVLVEAMTGTCLVDRLPRKALIPPVAIVVVACIAAFGLEGWILWNHAGNLAAAFLLSAIPVTILTFVVVQKMRNESDHP